MALGRLNRSMADLLAPIHPQNGPVLSSVIEEAHSSLLRLCRVELSRGAESPTGDSNQLGNYICALDKGLQLMKGGYPSWIQLIREVHAVLLSGECDDKADLGEFRQEQNWLYRGQQSDGTLVRNFCTSTPYQGVGMFASYGGVSQ